MKLKELLEALATPDHVDHKKALDMPVLFDTAGRFDLLLLSVYESDGIIRIDIGDGDE